MTKDRLSRILEQAARELSRPMDRPDESAILAYLSGSANEVQIRHVREAIASSAEFRRDVTEFGRTLDRLGDPDTAVRFDRESVPRAPSDGALRAPPTPRPAAERAAKSPGRWIGRPLVLFRKPAFAYALMIVIFAYPTYRAFFVTQRSMPAGSPVRESLSLFLREDRGGAMRGETPAPTLPRVEVPEGALLALSLEAPEGDGPWGATVATGDGREIWRSPAPLTARTTNGERVVTLALDPGRGLGGPVTVTLRGVEAADTVAVQYRFVLAVEPE